jgi:hypothetical protein
MVTELQDIQQTEETDETEEKKYELSVIIEFDGTAKAELNA